MTAVAAFVLSQTSDAEEVKAWVASETSPIFRLEYQVGKTIIHRVQSREIALRAKEDVDIKWVGINGDGSVGLAYFGDTEREERMFSLPLTGPIWSDIVPKDKFSDLANVPFIVGKGSYHTFLCAGHVYVHASPPEAVVTIPHDQISVSIVTPIALEGKIALLGTTKTGKEIQVWDVAKKEFVKKYMRENAATDTKDGEASDWEGQQIWWLDEKTLFVTGQFLRGAYCRQMLISLDGDGCHEFGNEKHDNCLYGFRNGVLYRVSKEGREKVNSQAPLK
jgi:hypothetical protein